MTNTVDAKALVEQLRHAKHIEEGAVEHRRNLEAQLVSLFGTNEITEGTAKFDDFSITYKVTRKVDSDALFPTFNDLPENAKKAFRFKADVSTSHYRALSELDAATFAKVAAFVTTTPAKPTVTLKD